MIMIINNNYSMKWLSQLIILLQKPISFLIPSCIPFYLFSDPCQILLMGLTCHAKFYQEPPTTRLLLSLLLWFFVYFYVQVATIDVTTKAMLNFNSKSWIAFAINSITWHWYKSNKIINTRTFIPLFTKSSRIFFTHTDIIFSCIHTSHDMHTRNHEEGPEYYSRIFFWDIISFFSPWHMM